MPYKKSGLPPTDPLPVHAHMFIRMESGKYTAYVIDDTNRAFPISINLSPYDVKNLNSLLQSAIQNVAGAIGKGAAYESALQQLAMQGTFAFKSIFKSTSAQNDVRDVLGQGTGRVVQIVSENFFIPWELLYDGPLEAATTIDGFWGARYIISRAIMQDERPGAHVSPRLETLRPKVGMVTSNTLSYVLEQEIPTLERLHNRKKIELTQLRQLAKERRNEELEAFGRFLAEEWHFLHFACHAYEQDPIEMSYLSITKDFSISMIDFVVSGFNLNYHPFVILNACQTGAMNPLYTSSWARKLWEHGARGVLATDFKVRDDFAAAFSAALYSDLLRGVPIGKALLNARWHFWEKERNPLGLAYALYSPPSIKVVKPHTS